MCKDCSAPFYKGPSRLSPKSIQPGKESIGEVLHSRMAKLVAVYTRGTENAQPGSDDFEHPDKLLNILDELLNILDEDLKLKEL